MTSRWPDEASYRDWLRLAQRKRVPATTPVPSPAPRKKKAPVSVGGVVDWSAAARQIKTG